MNDNQQADLKVLIHAACLNAARELGTKLKDMSWFGRNHEPVAVKKIA